MAKRILERYAARNGPERAGTGLNKRPRVLGEHPRHFLGTLERPERHGTAWNMDLDFFESPWSATVVDFDLPACWLPTDASLSDYRY